MTLEPYGRATRKSSSATGATATPFVAPAGECQHVTLSTDLEGMRMWTILLFGAVAADRPATQASVRGAAGLALLAAVTLDGVPENLALGISLTEGTGGIALLAAIFVSNLPEALVGAASMREQGRSAPQIIGLWSACAVLLIIAVVVGAGPLSGSDPEIVSLPLAFAAAP